MFRNVVSVNNISWPLPSLALLKEVETLMRWSLLSWCTLTWSLNYGPHIPYIHIVLLAVAKLKGKDIWETQV